MRMFDRDSREDREMRFVAAEDDPAVAQAIDTVARRLASMPFRYEKGDTEFADIGPDDWEKIRARAAELANSLDHGQSSFKAAYALLKARSNVV